MRSNRRRALRHQEPFEPCLLQNDKVRWSPVYFDFVIFVGGILTVLLADKLIDAIPIVLDILKVSSHNSDQNDRTEERYQSRSHFPMVTVNKSGVNSVLRYFDFFKRNKLLLFFEVGNSSYYTRASFSLLADLQKTMPVIMKLIPPQIPTATLSKGPVSSREPKRARVLIYFEIVRNFS